MTIYLVVSLMQAELENAYFLSILKFWKYGFGEKKRD